MYDFMSAESDLVDSGTPDTKGGFTLSAGNGASFTPVTLILGILGILVILRLLGDSESTDIQPAHILISAWNLLTIGLVSIVAILLAKVAVNTTPLMPGAIKDAVNAI